MLAACASMVGCLQPAAAATLNAENLRCEYLKDPLGIDVTQPRLSWELRADRGTALDAGENGNRRSTSSNAARGGTARIPGAGGVFAGAVEGGAG